MGGIRGGHDRRRCRGVAVAVVVLGTVLSACTVENRGPLFDGRLNPHAYIFDTDRGETVFADGFETFEAPADRDAVIESIRSIGLPDGVEVLGTLVSGPLGADGIYQSFDEYPPVEGLDGPVFEAAGATIPAGSGYYQIIIGYRSTVETMAVRSGVEVTYSVDGTTYRSTLPAAIIVCPPAIDEDVCSDEMDAVVSRLSEDR